MVDVHVMGSKPLEVTQDITDVVELSTPGHYACCKVQHLLESCSLGGIAYSIHTNTVSDE